MTGASIKHKGGFLECQWRIWILTVKTSMLLKKDKKKKKEKEYKKELKRKSNKKNQNQTGSSQEPSWKRKPSPVYLMLKPETGLNFW